jgi:Ca2+-binding RTX toxin-like protein
MATIQLGANIDAIKIVDAIGDFIDVLENSPKVVRGTASATMTWTEHSDDGTGQIKTVDHVVTYHFKNPGTSDDIVNGMDFAYVEDGVTHDIQTVTDLNLRFGAIDGAAKATTESGNNISIKALFDGIGWTLDASKTPTIAALVFQGTGGDDTFTGQKGKDIYLADGGNDKVDLGVGKDVIYLFNDLDYARGGVSTVDGGKGFDELDLGMNSPGHRPLFDHGVVIDLNTTIHLNTISLKLKDFEGVQGTIYADTFIGTNNAETFQGGGGDGADTMTGGGGGDTFYTGFGASNIFYYNAASDSTTGKSADTIMQFEHGLDTIDLSAIDSGRKNHAFKFVGADAPDHLGDLSVTFHADGDDSYSMVEINLDKDKDLEFEMKVFCVDHLAKGDFVL